MYVASQNGHTEVVDLLVQAGADIHLATTKVHVSTHTVSSSVAAVVETNVRLINPRCTGVRVTVLGLSICVCVCLSTFILELQATKQHMNGTLDLSAT